MRRLAIVLPVAYRGGTLRATRDLARILATAADPGALDVVVAYPAGVPDGLGSLQAWGLAVRSFQWRTIDRADAARMAAVSLVPFTRPIEHERYCLPSDGAADLLDCDFWLFVSDRVEAPLLPARPYGVVVFDCLQRYVPEIDTEAAWRAQVTSLVPFVREAEVVLVTTPATASDVHAFVGVPRARIRQVPLPFTPPPAPAGPSPWTEPYLVWVTNRSSHKNHARTLAGLEAYYEEHGGRLKTVVVGTETEWLAGGAPAHPVPIVEAYLKPLRKRLERSRSLRENLVVAGEISDAAYVATVAGARLLLHSSLYDNGAFAVLDAACLGVPSLAARYPAMEFLDRTFEAGATWFDPRDPADLARGLAAMERRPRAATPARPPSSPPTGAELRRALAPWLS